MAGNELGQFVYTAMAKGMSEQMRRLKSKAQHENGADGSGEDVHGRKQNYTADEDQTHHNLRMFMDVIEDFRGLVAQETGIGKEAEKNDKDTSMECEDRQENLQSPHQDHRLPQRPHTLLGVTPTGEFCEPGFQYCVTEKHMSAVGSKPTLQELHFMDMSGRPIEIIKKLAPKWHLFGDYLNFDSDGTNIEILKEKYRGDPEAGCKAMFQMWLRGKGTEPVTWQNLAQLVDRFGEKRLAAEIRILKT